MKTLTSSFLYCLFVIQLFQSETGTIHLVSSTKELLLVSHVTRPLVIISYDISYVKEIIFESPTFATMQLHHD